METAVSTIEHKPQILRVDKNFADNSLEWLSIFGKDALLCFDILLYITNNSQKDLFNYSQIDLNIFAKQMGYSKYNLQRIVENPSQFNLEKFKESVSDRTKKFITVFENSLYKLGRFTIPVSSSYFDETKNEYVHKTQFIQVLKEINIHISGNKDNSKIFYTYQSSEEFEFNLSRFFFLTDFNHFPKLKSSNLLLLYFYFRSLENGKHGYFQENDFDKLCRYAGIEFSQDNVKQAKYNLQKRKFDKLKEFIDFDYKTVPVTGKWKYGFEFRFNKNLYLNPTDTKQQDETILACANRDYIDLKLFKFYKEKYNLTETNKAIAKEYSYWFHNNLLDYDKKIEIIISCYARLFKIHKKVATTKYYHTAVEFLTKK